MPIEHTKGATTLTGDSIDYFALCSIKGALGLELKGIRIRRGLSVYATAKRKYGLKGSREKVYAELCRMVEESRVQQEHVEDGKRTVGGMEVQ